MEHITITDLGTGYYRLVPDEGYRLMKKSTPQYTYSEVVTKKPDDWSAVLA